MLILPLGGAGVYREVVMSHVAAVLDFFRVAPLAAVGFQIEEDRPGVAVVDRFEQTELGAVKLELALLVEGHPDLWILPAGAFDGLAIATECPCGGRDEATTLREGRDDGLRGEPHWPPGGSGHLGHIAAAVLFRMGPFHGRWIRKGRCPGGITFTPSIVLQVT